MRKADEDVNARLFGVPPEVQPALEEEAPRAVIYTHPWVFHEFGMDRVIDDLVGGGIDGVQLSFTYHVASFLMPRHPVRRLRFGIPGVLNFDPNRFGEVSWPFRAPVLPGAEGEDYVGQVVERLSDADIQSIAWVVYLYWHSLAAAMPHLAVENAFGDQHQAQLCPANPEVRDFVTSLSTAVLAHEGLRGLVAESLTFLPFDYGAMNLKAGAVPGCLATGLLSLCFCQHCARAGREAGTDVDLLRRRVRTLIPCELNRMPNVGSGPRVEEGLYCLEDVGVAEYQRSRVETVVSLQKEVLELVRARGLRAGTTAGEGQDEFVSAAPTDRLRPLRSEFRFELLPNHTREKLIGQIEVARERAGERIPIYALVQFNNFPDLQELRRTLECVSDSGVSHFRFYEYSVLSEAQLRALAELRSLWTAR